MLVAFFDLASHRKGAEIFTFLRLAELKRVAEGYDSVHLVIVSDGREMRSSAVALGRTRWDRSPYRISMASLLLTTVEGFSVCTTRDDVRQIIRDAEGAIFPEGYGLDSGVERFPEERTAAVKLVNTSKVLRAGGLPVEPLEVPRQAKDYINSWARAMFGTRPFISITLADSWGEHGFGISDENGRESIDPTRLRILRHFENTEIAVVLLTTGGLGDESLPEQYRHIPVLPGSDELSPLRLALYRSARLNLIEFPASLGLTAGDSRQRSVYFGENIADRWNSAELEIAAVDVDDGDAVRGLLSGPSGGFGLVSSGGGQETDQTAAVATVDSFFQRALKIQQDGADFPTAIKIYSAILRAHPHHAGALGMLGSMSMVHEQFEAAIPLLQEAAVLDRQEPAYAYNLGALYLALGLEEKAIACFETVVRLDADCYAAWGILGRLNADAGNHETAVTCFQRAMQAPQKSTEVMFCFADSLFTLGRHEEAAAIYEAAGDRYVELLDDEEAANVMSLSYRRIPTALRNAAFLGR